MSTPKPLIGYVVKRYPRYSETFIVNEILAHEAAGLELVIFSLGASEDAHFQDVIARVRAPVVYLPDRVQKASEFWTQIQRAASVCPDIWYRMVAARGVDARDVTRASALAQAVAERRVTHLHAHFATSATTVAKLAAHFTGVGYSFTAHAKDIFHEAVDTEDVKDKLSKAKAVVTVSDFNVNYLREQHGLVARKVQRIYNGLDLSRFEFDTSEDRPPEIVAVGRLVEKKGLRHLVDACAMLKHRGVDFHCRIIGDGPEEATLRDQIDSLELAHRVVLEGPMPQDDVKMALRRAAVFAAPCIIGRDGDRDGLPTVLLEAMALGTPCVATDVTGIPEVIHDGKTGCLVTQQDPMELALTIERMMTDKALWNTLRHNARRLIETQFDVHNNAYKLRKLFHQNSRMPNLLTAMA